MQWRVAPFTGAWIEIWSVAQSPMEQPRSLPSRERGLKFKCFLLHMGVSGSLPSRERGLKLGGLVGEHLEHLVAPFTGAWIEMDETVTASAPTSSLPSRERGLKCG